MKFTKKLVSLLLVFGMALGLLPATAVLAEEEYIYLSVSFDGTYIDDQYGTPMVYMPIPLDAVAAVDLADYGLEHMLFDGDQDGNYDTTALQLLIYAHEEIYGGDWGEVTFDDIPGSSYFRDGIFGFTENLVYFHNGDFPIDETQASDFMTVGATSDRITLQAGDFLDVASFSCYSFLWDMAGGFHMFADPDGNYVHDYTAMAGEALTVKLMHSFCDLMYGEAWVYDATDYTVYYGTDFGQAEGSVTTDDTGLAEIIFPEAGTYYVWCDGGHSDDYTTHSSCDYCLAYDEPCVVSAPAYAKVIVAGDTEEQPQPVGRVKKWNIVLTDALNVNFYLNVSDSIANTATVNISVADSVVTYKVSDLSKTEEGYYVAQIPLAAAQMTDDIVVFIMNNHTVCSYANYTIRQYVDAVLQDESLSMYHDLVQKMLHYGAAAQTYFDYHTDRPANAGIGQTGADRIPTDYDSDPTVSGYAEGVSFYGATLSFRDRIAVRYYFRFTGDITTVSFTANGESYAPALKNGLYYVEIPDILPQHLDQSILLTITDASGEALHVSYSPMDYILRMSNGENEALNNLLQALYNYHVAAKQVAG